MDNLFFLEFCLFFSVEFGCLLIKLESMNKTVGFLVIVDFLL
jgi:hypothetical protein